MHDGRELIVHRKGATPAGEGVLGVIPGSMADPGFVVRGKGEAGVACDSASHGAGRAMSRTRGQGSVHLEQMPARCSPSAGVTLLSAGIDEVPLAYKDIHEVMAAQRDLVEVLARVRPAHCEDGAGG